MTNSEGRSSGMNPEQLRETIVQTAIPLIADWDAVTTAQIARNAGIDDATLLRVFNDKDAILIAAIHAHVMTALDPTQVVQELQSIALDQPLAAHLVEAIDALDTYHGHIVTFFAPMGASGTPQGKPTPDSGTAGESRLRPFNPEDFRAAARIDVIAHAVTKLLEPACAASQQMAVIEPSYSRRSTATLGPDPYLVPRMEQSQPGGLPPRRSAVIL